MNNTVYVLGNLQLSSDSLPLQILPLLKKRCPYIDFDLLDPTEELIFNNDQDLTLIDTVIGIDKVTIFHDLSCFAYSPRITVHDYDLPINLGILQKLKKIKNITIIGVPKTGDTEEILQEVISALHIHLTFRK